MPVAHRPPVYLDYAASAPVRPEVREAMAAALEAGGNPSSVHATGRKARERVEAARTRVSALVGAAPERLVFTSGGAEANALGLAAHVADVDQILIGATEHEAVSETALRLGLPVRSLPVTETGVVDLQVLQEALTTGGRALVALMLANNETGVIHPIAEVAAMVRQLGGRLHVDAVQAVGKIAVDIDDLGAHSLAISSHKLGGPQGAGALAFAEGVKPKPLWGGGGQEFGLRSGTENTPAISGFGVAADMAHQELAGFANHAAARDATASAAKALGAVVLGEGAPRLPNLICLACPGWESMRQVMRLDLDGVQVSAGAACASGKVRPSRVAEAMGAGHLAPFVLRVSSGWATGPNDWKRFLEVYRDGAARHLSRAPAEVN